MLMNNLTKMFSTGMLSILTLFLVSTSNDFSESGRHSPEDNGTSGKVKSSWYRSNKLLKSFELGKQGDEDGQRKSKLLARLTILSSLIMVVDMVEKNLIQASVMKNVESYMPNTVWKHHNRMIEMMFHVQKEHVVKQIDMWMAQNLSLEELKIQFLQLISIFFRSYHEEAFTAKCFRPHKPDEKPFVVRLKVTVPFKSEEKPFEEWEPTLVMEEERTRSNKEFHSILTEEEKQICTIEELCYISVAKSGNGIQLGRKNGTHVSFLFSKQSQVSSFLTLVSGYYRLCEKWIFSLCDAIVFPTMQSLLKEHVHGPIHPDFAERKFITNSEQDPGKVQWKPRGTYLIHQSCNDANHFMLHYIRRENCKPEVLNIVKIEENRFCVKQTTPHTYYQLEVEFDSISHIIKTIKKLYTEVSDLPSTQQQSIPLLNNCLHPSEYDKAPTLLLCRSIQKLEDDVYRTEGTAQSNIDFASKPVFIEDHQLSRIENRKFRGHFTNVWQGIWSKSRHEKIDVAIKQLKPEHFKSNSILLDFIKTSHAAMRWNHDTLRKIHAFSLATMTMVMEYYPLGSLNQFLNYNKGIIEAVDLVEAATSLAKALWYLEEHNLVHGNIRCDKIFVVSHDPGNSFKIKLGEPGLPDFKKPNQIYWMPLHMLCQGELSWEKCNSKCDVWAFATTLWQIFCDGQEPLNTPFSNFDGSSGNFLLPQPPALRGTLGQVYYDIMLHCWQPDINRQKAPQAIMKDMNQVLYNVFNSKHINAYTTIDDNDYTLKVDTYQSPNTTCTTLEQEQMVALGSKEASDRSINVTPTFSDFSQGGRVVIVTNGSGDR